MGVSKKQDSNLPWKCYKNDSLCEYVYIQREAEYVTPSERQTRSPQHNKLMKCELLYNVEFFTVESQATKGSLLASQNDLSRLPNLPFRIFQCWHDVRRSLTQNLKCICHPNGVFQKRKKNVGILTITCHDPQAIFAVLMCFWEIPHWGGLFYFSFKLHPICQSWFKGTN